MVRTKKKGFTLIELLVVISIIALLLSILMPALSKVKEKARAVVCQSRLKQLGLGIHLYTVDYDGKLWTFADRVREGSGERIHWYHMIAPYMASADYKVNSRKNLKGAMEVVWCPSTKEPTNSDVTQLVWGTAKHRYRFLEGESGYGINSWLTYNPANVTMGFAEAKHWRKYADARPNTPVLYDATWVGNLPGDRDFPPYDKYDLEYGTCHGFRGLVGYQMTRLCIDRHDMAINMTFVDGSVQKVWLKDLWKFPWHKNFQTKSYSRMPVR